MMKKYFLTLALTTLALFSVQSQAFIITQSLDLEVTYADAGNDFGLAAGYYDDIGFVTYDTSDPTVAGFGFADPTTSGFSLTLDFGSLFFTEAMDTGAPFFPVAELVDAADPLSGIGRIDAFLMDFAGNTVELAGDVFGLVDAGFREVGGFFSVDRVGNVPAPATFALLAFGLGLLRIQRRTV